MGKQIHGAAYVFSLQTKYGLPANQHGLNG